MTTDDDQLSLVTTSEQRMAYETVLALHLTRLSAWTALPDERTDWDLEQLLDDIRTTALAVRQLRGDEELPF